MAVGKAVETAQEEQRDLYYKAARLTRLVQVTL